MKDDVVSLTTAKIVSIIKEHRKLSKNEVVHIILSNVAGCKGSEAQLRLQIDYEGKSTSQIVSGCLKLEEIGRIKRSVSSFCEQEKMGISYLP
jgi:hypothetical protein